ncbi:MAG: hypothetical protein ABDH28_05700 [Brevinematia bacterium]
MKLTAYVCSFLLGFMLGGIVLWLLFSRQSEEFHPPKTVTNTQVKAIRLYYTNIIRHYFTNYQEKNGTNYQVGFVDITNILTNVLMQEEIRISEIKENKLLFSYNYNFSTSGQQLEVGYYRYFFSIGGINTFVGAKATYPWGVGLGILVEF